jgi:epoxyqueuosine reductase
MTPAAKTQLVRTLARQTGFDLVGITSPGPVRRITYYRQWLAAGYGGTMTYLARNVQVRAVPARLLAGARSIICLAVNYKRPDGYLGPARALASPASDAAELTGSIAQYARGYDYHVVLHRMMRTLVARLRDSVGEPFESRVFADTAPILEKELAAAAGLGWLGKNTCLLNSRWGSYLLLGEVLTSLDLAFTAALPDGCGSCRRCLDACPSGALIGHHRINAARCISYLTIEHRGPIESHARQAVGDRLIGCDICQQVCPYNARSPLATHPQIGANVLPPRVKLDSINGLREDEYRVMTRSSAARRATCAMWRRNAGIVRANAARR